MPPVKPLLLLSLPPPWPQKILLSADQKSGGKALRTTEPPASIFPSCRVVLKRVKRASSVSQTSSLLPSSYLSKRWNDPALMSVLSWNIAKGMGCLLHWLVWNTTEGAVWLIQTTQSDFSALIAHRLTDCNSPPPFSYPSFLERSASVQHWVEHYSNCVTWKTKSGILSNFCLLVFFFFCSLKMYCLGPFFSSF